MNWPWSKTYKHTCQDGSVKTIYKTVDYAFPLFIPGWEARIEGGTNAFGEVEARLEAQYASKIQGLLINLDKANRNLVLSFRVVYVVYQGDPCSHSDFLTRHVSKILEEENKLNRLQIQIQGLMDLAERHLEDAGAFWTLYRDVLMQLGGPSIQEEVSRELADSSANAMSWTGGATW